MTPKNQRGQAQLGRRRMKWVRSSKKWEEGGLGGSVILDNSPIREKNDSGKAGVGNRGKTYGGG